MDKILIAFIFSQIAWFTGWYFLYQIFFKNQNRYLEAILCCMLFGVCGWVLGIAVVMWISVLEIALLVIRWKVNPITGKDK